MSKRIIYIVTELALDILRGMALLALVLPFALYQFIHGDTERYIWLISGPEPFSNFGGGPYQLMMYLSLVTFGTVLFIMTSFIKKKIRLLKVRHM